MMKRLAREEGLLVGISAAAAMVGSLRVAEEAEPDSVIVTIFPDGADRYSERALLGGVLNASQATVRTMALRIAKPEWMDLRQHGEETYPHECCGVLLGTLDG